MRILLSIKPEFVDKIFAGTKGYEFRKGAFKRPGITTVVVYSTKPVGQIVGEFDIEEVLRHEPNTLWTMTHHAAGIDETFFDAYFAGRDSGVAIKIGECRLYEQPIDPKELVNRFVAPQSYRYLTDDCLMRSGQTCIFPPMESPAPPEEDKAREISKGESRAPWPWLFRAE